MFLQRIPNIKVYIKEKHYNINYPNHYTPHMSSQFIIELYLVLPTPVVGDHIYTSVNVIPFEEPDRAYSS